MAFDIKFEVGDNPELGGLNVNQIELLTAINNELCRQFPGIAAEPRLFNAVIKAANLIADEYAKPIVKATPGMGLMAWLASDDVGMSSKYMASVLAMSGSRSEFAYPRDPDDLGRCIRLVRAVPKIRSKIKLMADHGPQWKAVVENWDRWEAMYDDEDDDGTLLYEEMEAAYAQ